MLFNGASPREQAPSWPRKNGPTPNTVVLDGDDACAMVSDLKFAIYQWSWPETMDAGDPLDAFEHLASLGRSLTTVADALRTAEQRDRNADRHEDVST